MLPRIGWLEVTTCLLKWPFPREPSNSVGGNANYYSHYGEQCGDFLKKLEIELSYDPAIPLLGIHIEETRIESDMCTPMFTAALYNSQDMEAT